MNFRNYINIRTLIILILSQLSCFAAIQLNFKLHFNFVLFGLAIAFPLGTSIQTAFKRREKALEYLSLFNSGLLAIHYSFVTSEKLTPEQKDKARQILLSASDKLLHQLQTSDGDMSHFQPSMDEIFRFIEDHNDEMSSRIVARIVRYTEDVADSAAYLLSLVVHRTMTGLRTYAIIFIALFAALHGPQLYYTLGQIFPDWAIYLSAALTSMILITLYNFQQLIEYPFDQKGSDDVQLDKFKLNI